VRALEPGLLINRLAVDQEALDGGASRRKDRRDNRELALVAEIFELAAFALGNEIAFEVVANRKPVAENVRRRAAGGAYWNSTSSLASP
jgi:hypothetical protein